MPFVRYFPVLQFADPVISFGVCKKFVRHFQSPHPNDSATLKTLLNTQSISLVYQMINILKKLSYRR